MLIFLSIIVVLAVLFLTARLRIRLNLASDRKLLFVGLGRSGPEFHLGERKGELRLFGFRLFSFAAGKEKKKEKRIGEKISEAIAKEKTSKPAKPKKKRRRPLKEMLRAVPQCSKALWLYFMDLLKAFIIEEAEGEIEGGFDAPDLTGQAFGFYQAALGAVPALAGRFRYTPDWTGASFSGAVRLTVALPMYRLVGRTLMLLWRLPVIKIVKLAIGKRGGVQDGEQRS